jgi:hypothetical protein
MEFEDHCAEGTGNDTASAALHSAMEIASRTTKSSKFDASTKCHLVIMWMHFL